MEGLIGPALADVLQSNRERFNARFTQARRDFPRLEGAVFLDCLRRRLDPIVGAAADQQAAQVAELVDVLYEVMLEMLGKGLVGPRSRVADFESLWAELMMRVVASIARWFRSYALEVWEFGESLEQVDWLESVMVSPVVIPGVTTRQRLWGTSEGTDVEKRPIDLDLYIDCSGSMPNPQHTLSPVALAAAIISLSALRVGAAVQATLWSGAGQFETTDGFIRNTAQVLRVLTGFIGGGTACPIHILRDTYAQRRLTSRAVHILVVSDDGVTTTWLARIAPQNRGRN
jgi:hypothetical protein